MIRPWFRRGTVAARPAQPQANEPIPPPQPRPPPPRTPIRPPPPRQQAPPPPPPRPLQPPSPPPPRQPTPPRQPSPPPPPPPQQPTPPRQPSPPPPPPPRQPTPPPPPPPRQPTPPPPPPPRQPSPPPHSPVKPVTQRSPPQPPSPGPSTPSSRVGSLPPSPKEVQVAPRRVVETPPLSRAAAPRSLKPEPKTPPEPPKSKSPSARVSPFSLPPAQLKHASPEDEATQKNVLTAEKPSHVHQQKEHHKTKKVLPSDSKDLGARVITIAGENKGAVMEITQSPRKGSPKFRGNSRVLNEETAKGKGSGEEGSEDEKEKGNNGKMTSPNNNTLPMRTFMNSNVQMINNSIVYNSTSTHNDPGLHLSLRRKPEAGNGFHVKDHKNGYTS